jgi:peptide/nickel transport system permease protein
MADAGPGRWDRADRVWHAVVARPSGVIGLVITVIVVVVSIFASLLAPHSAYYQFPNGLTQNGTPVGPGREFLLGTDALGRDLLSRLLIGLQNTMVVAVAANVIAAAIGVIVGAVAGYAGRWVDVVLMRITEVLLAVPAILLAGFLALVTQPSKVSLIIIIAAVNWFYLARIVRGEVLVIRTREFVEASVSAGARHRRVLLRHVLPQVWPLVAVYTTLQFSTTTLFVASLSFVGIGIQPPTPSLGDLISDGTTYLTSVPRLAIIPGIALGFVVLGFNLLGDALRDALAGRS